MTNRTIRTVQTEIRHMQAEIKLLSDKLPEYRHKSKYSITIRDQMKNADLLAASQSRIFELKERILVAELEIKQIVEDRKARRRQRKV